MPDHLYFEGVCGIIGAEDDAGNRYLIFSFQETPMPMSEAQVLFDHLLSLGWITAGNQPQS